MTTFTISVVCSEWYYGTNGVSFLESSKFMAKQFGTLVYGAMLVAVVTIVRMFVEEKKRQTQNLGMQFCLCVMGCVLKTIENLLHVVNHFTVIMVAVSGEDYLSGAKSAIGLLWK
jgi:hypothetical protein